MHRIQSAATNPVLVLQPWNWAVYFFGFEINSSSDIWLDEVPLVFADMNDNNKKFEIFFIAEMLPYCNRILTNWGTGICAVYKKKEKKKDEGPIYGETN